MKRVVSLVCVMMLGLWGITGFAEQTEDVDYLSIPGKFGVAGLYTLIDAETLGDKTLSIGLIGDWTEFCLPSDPRTPQMMEGAVYTGFSLNKRFEVGAFFPFRRLEVSEKSPLEGFDETGMGDILATAKAVLLNESEVIPAIGLYTTVSFPTGDEEKGLGSGSVDVTFGGAITKRLGMLKLYGNVGFLLSGYEAGDPNPTFDTYQNALLYGAGFEFPLTNDTFRLFSEFTFVKEFGQDEEDYIISFAHSVVEDVVDDAGQASVGIKLNLVDGLLLSGGAAFRIVGEEPVLDSPVWRAFVNIGYMFGRRKQPEAALVPPPEVAPVILPNRCPEITEISLSDSMVGGDEQVRAAATVIDPDSDKLFYFWSANGGELTGRGPQVIWTSPSCSVIGNVMTEFDIKVEVSDGECTVERFTTITVDCSSAPVVLQPDVVVLFPAGKTTLNNIAKAQLDKIAALLKQFPDQTILLEGHTDATGTDDRNQQIALKRAESVKAYLVQRHGIDPNRITMVSYGATRPVAPNDTKEGRDQNRRVEIYRTL